MSTRKRPATGNSKSDQLSRLLEVVRAAHLTVYQIVVEPRGFRIVTQPLGESPVAEDPADKWLRGKMDEGATGGRP